MPESDKAPEDVMDTDAPEAIGYVGLVQEDLSPEEARSKVDDWLLAPMELSAGEENLKEVSHSLRILGQFHPRLKSALDDAVAELDILRDRARNIDFSFRASTLSWQLLLQLDQEERAQKQGRQRAEEIKEALARKEGRLSNTRARLQQIESLMENARSRVDRACKNLKSKGEENNLIDRDSCKYLGRVLDIRAWS